MSKSRELASWVFKETFHVSALQVAWPLLQILVVVLVGLISLEAKAVQAVVPVVQPIKTVTVVDAATPDALTKQSI
jgi:hypothetical protein